MAHVAELWQGLVICSRHWHFRHVQRGKDCISQNTHSHTKKVKRACHSPIWHAAAAPTTATAAAAAAGHLEGLPHLLLLYCLLRKTLRSSWHCLMDDAPATFDTPAQSELKLVMCAWFMIGNNSCCTRGVH